MIGESKDLRIYGFEDLIVPILKSSNSQILKFAI